VVAGPDRGQATDHPAARSTVLVDASPALEVYDVEDRPTSTPRTAAVVFWPVGPRTACEGAPVVVGG